MRSPHVKLLVPAVVLSAVSALGLGLLVAPSTAAPAAHDSLVTGKTQRPKPKLTEEYVALGDSWTADVVLVNGDGVPDTTYAPIDCAQSHRNYPKLVAKALGVTRFKDASCGSATTDDFANPQTGLPIGGTNPAQFDRLSRKTTLVTVGIGGNDAGIASAGLDCLNLLPVDNPLANNPAGLPFGGCRAKYTAGGHDQLSESIQASEIKLVRAFKAIRRISPKARVLAVNYLSVVPDHACYPTVPSTDTDMSYIHDKFIELNKMMKRAARKGGAEYVDVYTASLGHDLCTGPTVRYAEVLGLSVNDVAVGIPAHPNAAGARAQAQAVLDHLRAR